MSQIHLLIVLISSTAAQIASKCDTITASNQYTGTDITIPPRAVNVSVNGAAVFNCTAVGNSFIWRANGIEIDEGMGTILMQVLVDGTEGIRRSTLRVSVSSTDNAANITCVAISSSPLSIDKSDPVLLLVQGILLFF